VLKLAAPSTVSADVFTPSNPFAPSGSGLLAFDPMTANARAILTQEVAARAAADAKRVADLKAPAAQSERANSRTAFSALSASDAELVARQKFAALMSPVPASALRLPPGARRDGYLSDYAARVIAADGSTLVAESTLPLRTTDASGDKVATDLSLGPNQHRRRRD
jgi:hypothetical protein